MKQKLPNLSIQQIERWTRRKIKLKLKQNLSFHKLKDDEEQNWNRMIENKLWVFHKAWETSGEGSRFPPNLLLQ